MNLWLCILYTYICITLYHTIYVHVFIPHLLECGDYFFFQYSQKQNQVPNYPIGRPTPRPGPSYQGPRPSYTTSRPSYSSTARQQIKRRVFMLCIHIFFCVCVIRITQRFWFNIVWKVSNYPRSLDYVPYYSLLGQERRNNVIIPWLVVQEAWCRSSQQGRETARPHQRPPASGYQPRGLR